MPYAIGYSNATTLQVDSYGDTPGQACAVFAGLYAGHTTQINENSCTVSTIAGRAFPVVKVCDTTPQFTSDKIADMSLMWGAFFLVIIVAFTLRKLLNIFEAAPHGD